MEKFCKKCNHRDPSIKLRECNICKCHICKVCRGKFNLICGYKSYSYKKRHCRQVLCHTCRETILLCYKCLNYKSCSESESDEVINKTSKIIDKKYDTTDSEGSPDIPKKDPDISKRNLPNISKRNNSDVSHILLSKPRSSSIPISQKSK